MYSGISTRSWACGYVPVARISVCLSRSWVGLARSVVVAAHLTLLLTPLALKQRIYYVWCFWVVRWVVNTLNLESIYSDGQFDQTCPNLEPNGVNLMKLLIFWPHHLNLPTSPNQLGHLGCCILEIALVVQSLPISIMSHNICLVCLLLGLWPISMSFLPLAGPPPNCLDNKKFHRWQLFVLYTSSLHTCPLADHHTLEVLVVLSILWSNMSLGGPLHGLWQ